MKLYALAMAALLTTNGAFAAAEKKEKNYEFNVSGFALVEYEYSRNFGYNDGGANTVADFNKLAGGHKRSQVSLLSNLNLDFESKNTKFKTVTEIGDVVLGDDATGGRATEEKEIVQVRNIYLNHQLNSEVDLTAGLFYLSSDPRGFLIGDDYGGAQAQYVKNDMLFKMYYAIAQDSIPNEAEIESEKFFGLMASDVFGSINTTVYGLHSTNMDTTDSGSNQLWWLGATLSSEVMTGLTVEGTYIYNHKRFQGNDDNGTPDDSSNASLIDLKASYNVESLSTVFSFEHLRTSGSKAADPADESFVSPADTTYILNIATSDGWMEYPGTKKTSYVAGLGQTQGLQAYVLAANMTVNDKVKTYARYGLLQSEEEQNGTTDMGYEIDLGGSYQLDEQTKILLDLGYLNPDTFYAKQDLATLAALGVRYDF